MILAARARAKHRCRLEHCRPLEYLRLEYPRVAAVVEDIARAETCNEEKIEELAEIICRANVRCAAALVVLMRTLEKFIDAKPLVDEAKHFAFARCAEANLLGLVDTQTAVIEPSCW